MRVENDRTKDWLNTIGNADYSERDNCKVYRPPRDQNLVPIFISIGYQQRGVNYISLVFAPDYQNSNPELEVDLSIGVYTVDTEFVNLPFSQRNAFIGF